MKIYSKHYATGIHDQISRGGESLRNECLDEFVEEAVAERKQEGFVCNGSGKIAWRSEKP